MNWEDVNGIILFMDHSRQHSLFPDKSQDKHLEDQYSVFGMFSEFLRCRWLWLFFLQTVCRKLTINVRLWTLKLILMSPLKSKYQASAPYKEHHIIYLSSEKCCPLLCINHLIQKYFIPKYFRVRFRWTISRWQYSLGPSTAPLGKWWFNLHIYF